MQILSTKERGALNVRAAAQYLSIGRSSVYELVKDRKVRDVKIAGRRVILREDLDRLLQEAAK